MLRLLIRVWFGRLFISRILILGNESNDYNLTFWMKHQLARENDSLHFLFGCLSTHQSRRSRKNDNYHHINPYGNNGEDSSGSGGMLGSVPLPYQEEEVSMRSAAKVLSNTRAPSSFVLCSNNHHHYHNMHLKDQYNQLKHGIVYLKNALANAFIYSKKLV